MTLADRGVGTARPIWEVGHAGGGDQSWEPSGEPSSADVGPRGALCSHESGRTCVLHQVGGRGQVGDLFHRRQCWPHYVRDGGRSRQCLKGLLCKGVCHDAFADHAAEFWLTIGGDPGRALWLAQHNLSLRQTPRARALVRRSSGHPPG